MTKRLTRRRFVEAGGAATTLVGLSPNLLTGLAQSGGSRPVVVSSANGIPANEKAMQMIRAGADTLDAIVAGVNIVEDDPKDNSVGYGGLPNAEGDVELDASVMHGPTRRAGAVASLRHVKNPSKVAKLVMERTDHLLLVGEGALRFAVAHGFQKEDLLTNESRQVWLRWRESMSDRDAWGPGLAAPESSPTSLLNESPDEREIRLLAARVIANPPTGTINCIAVNEKGDISGVTTTSGLAFKIPGRVGDSPLIGCGLFVDNEVGAAGSTGRGEECIKINGAHTVVEMMRRGASPTDACLEAIKRIAANYSNDKKKLEKFNINFYALNKRGEYGAATLWGFGVTRRGEKRPTRYAVHDGKENKLRESAYLFESRQLTE